MALTITQKSTGKTFTAKWRDGKNYNGMVCSFLYNVPRMGRTDFQVTTEDGRNVTSKAFAAASEEMNAIRNGRRIPAEPQF